MFAMSLGISGMRRTFYDAPTYVVVRRSQRFMSLSVLTQLFVVSIIWKSPAPSPPLSNQGIRRGTYSQPPVDVETVLHHYDESTPTYNVHV
jgi:hypothetical protein